MDMMTAEMFIYNSAKVNFLFASWSTYKPMDGMMTDMVVVNKWAYFACVLCTFVVALLTEFLSSRDPKSHVMATVNYFFKLLFSYTLMLIVMTYNAGLLISAVLGLSFGYLLFGFTPVKIIVLNTDSNLLANEWRDSLI